jgi:hypothetical protein
MSGFILRCHRLLLTARTCWTVLAVFLAVAGTADYFLCSGEEGISFHYVDRMLETMSQSSVVQRWYRYWTPCTKKRTHVTSCFSTVTLPMCGGHASYSTCYRLLIERDQVIQYPLLLFYCSQTLRMFTVNLLRHLLRHVVFDVRGLSVSSYSGVGHT